MGNCASCCRATLSWQPQQLRRRRELGDRAWRQTRVNFLGREVAADTATLDVSEWKLTAAHVGSHVGRGVAGALPQLLCLRELVLDGVPVSGSTPRHGGDFRRGVKVVDAGLRVFRALCEALRVCKELASLSMKKCYLGPNALALLAVVFRDASASITSCCILNNPMGESVNEIIKVFQDTPRLRTLCGFEEGIEEVDWSNSEKGVADVTLLAAELTAGRAIGSLTSCCLLHNPLGEGVNEIIKVFEQTPRLRTLCGFEEGIETIDWSNSGKGVVDVALLSADLAAGRATASVASLTLSSYPIGRPLITLVEGTKADVQVAKGVFAVVDGRWGEVINYQESYDFLVKDYGPSPHVKMKWLDNGSKSGWYSTIKFESTVASRTDLVEDYSHIEQLGKAVTRLTSLVLSKCELKSSSIASLTRSVSWAEASLAEIVLDGCPLTGATYYNGTLSENIDSQMDGFVALCAVLGKLEKISLAKCGLGAASAGELAKAVSSAGASIKVINLSECPLTGAICEYGDWNNIDSDMTGFIAFCGVLGKLHEVNLSGCQLGPTSAAELGKAISSADASLTSYCLLHNPLGEGVNEIIKVFEQTPRLRTICGFEEGIETIDWSNSGKGVVDVALLSADLAAG
eukprot:COSAG05_NODE_2205_length_3403_cov_2.502421_3_plen_630_part_01